MYRNSFVPAIDTGGIALTATDPALPATLGASLAHGTFLNAATARYPAVVLGAEAASLLGINNLANPTQVWLGGHWFTVVGILNPVEPGHQMDSMAFIGFPIAEQYFGFDGHPTELYLRSVPSQVNAVAAVLPATVNPANPSTVQVSQPSDILKAEVAAKGAYNGLLLGLGAVALLVGGVGIANVMVISVLERRSEIGLRRALGATRRHVAEQFLAEALLLSALGGLAGTVIGGRPPPSTPSANTGRSLIPAQAFYGGIGAALVIGAIAGLYPSMRAARLSPTEALRTDDLPEGSRLAAGEAGDQHGRQGQQDRHDRQRQAVADAAGGPGSSTRRCSRAVTAQAEAPSAWAGDGRARGHRQQRRDERAPAAAAGRGVVGAHLGQPGDVLGSAGEQRHRGKGRGEAPGDRDQQVVAAGQVRPLVREHGGELSLVEHGKGAAADHDRGGPAGQAVRDRLRGVENHGVVVAGQPAAGDASDVGVRAGLPLGPLHAAPVTPGQHRRGQSGDDRGRPKRELHGRALVPGCGARVPGDRAAHHLGQPAPASDRGPGQELERDRRRGQRARHRGQPRRQPEPGADAARGQPAEQRRRPAGNGHRVAEQQRRRGHCGRRSARRRTTARSISDSSPSIWATKWLSTAWVSPPLSSASRIRRALYSSRLAVAVYR